MVNWRNNRMKVYPAHPVATRSLLCCDFREDEQIYFLVHEQITGSNIPQYENNLLDSWRDMIETQRRPLESSRRALEYYRAMRKVLGAIIS